MTRINYTGCPLCNSTKLYGFMKIKDYFLSGESFELQKCNSCGFVFTQGHPDKNEIAEYYKSEEYISHSDIRRGLVNKTYHYARQFMLGSKRRLIRKYIGESSGSILDIGSGTGFFLKHMKDHGWKVKAIEPSEEGRAFCKREFSIDAQKPGELFKMEDRSFDAISMWHVLEHVEDMNGYMKKIFSLLKNDGKAFIALPNHSSLDAAMYKDKWAAWDVPRHLWHFTPKTFESLALKHNFKLLKKKSMPLDAVYVSILSEKYRNKPFPLIRGGLIGIVSLIRGLISLNKSSSIIYVLNK